MKSNRLAMIGLDAAELSFIQQHAEELPTLSRLLAEGSAKRLASTAAQLAGSVWPTFYTGVLPGEHGIYHHLQWDQSAMRLRRVTDAWLWAEPFWYELERRGKRVISIDVPMTFPSRLSLGTEVINWGSHDTLSATSTRPANVKREIDKRFGPHPMGCEIPVNKTADEIETIRANLVAGARRKGELSRWLAEREPWDFFLTVFGETHRGGHILWPERVPHGERSVIPSTALLDVYRAVDDGVGHLLESSSMQGATIVLFALHGMGDNISQEHFVPKIVDRMNAAFAGAKFGEENPSAPATHGQRSLMRTLREKLPAGLQNTIARSVPVGVRDFVVNRSITAGHDWSKTPGFALLADLHGYFRFNLRGREREGSLDRASADFERYKQFMHDTFADLTIPATGAPLVKEVLFNSFPGARKDHLPDAIFSWNVAEQASEIHSKELGTIRATPATGRSGNHKPHGFCSVSGSDMSDLSNVDHIADLASLAKRLLGFD
jgi:predicted AlkP superfamily phosphohydrolase/phosphomutase